jgi:hypothetical protein
VPAEAFELSGAALAEAPAVVEGGAAVALSLNLQEGSGPATVFVPEGALAANGVNNAASNTLAIERDTAPPVPLITTPGNKGVTAATQITFSVDFGEPVLAADPFALFSYAGAQRLDAVLDVAAGRLDVTAYVLPEAEGQQADIT